MSSFLATFVAVGIGLWLVSFAVEALRPEPKAPRVLSWAPEIPITHVDVDGFKLRYIRAGRGPNVVLLHTLRTQLRPHLEYFEFRANGNTTNTLRVGIGFVFRIGKKS